MALTNAQKQERWRRRNRIVLGDDAEDIAAKLITLDRRKLRRIVTLLTRHLKAVRGLRKDEARSRAYVQENTRRWHKLWLAEGRSLVDYRAGIGDHDSEVWQWLRAHAQAADVREREAWLEDHPGNPLPEHFCGMSEAEGREYDRWLMAYEVRPAKRRRQSR